MCPNNSDCVNFDGSFDCIAMKRYIAEVYGSFINIDECIESNSCHSDADCSDTDGSYECSCVSGYHGDGITCDDVNECANLPCMPNAICSNNIVSFACSCKTGYRLMKDVG